jgi:ribosomal protein S27AE
MPIKPSSTEALREASKSTCRCTQCGGQAKLWSDRWACPECGYFEFVAAANAGADHLGQWEETETFEGLVDKTHFWARHAQGGGSSQLNSLAHAAIYASRALRILAMKLRTR